MRLALARGLPDIGPLSLLLREEPDLRSALRSLQSYIHLHSRSIKIVLEAGGEFPILRGYLIPGASGDQASQTSEMILCAITQMVRWLVGEDWTPMAVCFTHPAPLSQSQHRRVFGCQVEFGHEIDAIVLEPSNLTLPISHNAPVLRRYAEDYVRNLADRHQQSAHEEVLGLISGLLPTGTCSASRIAKHLEIDRSTLYRRLAAEGHSYSRLLQSARMDLANKYQALGLPFVAMSEQLGFSSISVFSRWFRSARGSSPRDFRKSTAALASDRTTLQSA